MGRRVREASLQCLFVLLVVLGVASCVPLPFELCGEDKMGVEAIEINSFPVEAGSTVIVTARYRPQVSVSGGHAVITASVLGLPLQEVRNVCSEVTCPVLKGKVSNTTHHGRVPRLILPGTFTVDVTVDVTDSAGSSLTCIKTSVPIHAKGIFSLATVTTHPSPFPPYPTSPSDVSFETAHALGVETIEHRGRKRDGATAIHPLAQQLLGAMEQYLRHRPLDQPLLRGGSHPL